ncbi:hypothetical protein TWF192_002118 [Orbilia oligospora]|nr:hypothetical protein TWF192_002118 [Orbilia oligospora]
MGLKICNLANAASLLWHGLKALPEPSNRVNWAGVCGRAARTAETQIVDDVHSDVSHVACDSSTKSEIVVPILFNGEVVGVIDIDCEEEKGFTGEDREALERIAMLLAAGCDWASLKTK